MRPRSVLVQLCYFAWSLCIGSWLQIDCGFASESVHEYLNLTSWINISSTSTCGIRSPETFFVWTTTGKSKGFHQETCDSRQQATSHPIDYAIDGTNSYWKSENSKNKVSVIIDFGQEFYVTSVLIKMGPSPRPAEWLLERSSDFGRTYSPWEYFVTSPSGTDYCLVKFGIVANEKVTRDDQVLCRQSSTITYLENEEIIVKLVEGRPSANIFHTSTVLQNWSMATNIRFQFLRLYTFLGELQHKDKGVIQMHYYTLRSIAIGGRCVCHGHDKGCIYNATSQRMQCVCKHNTCGANCGQCCPGFNQQRWKPANISSSHTSSNCKACNCFGHSNDCYYNSTVEKMRLSRDMEGKFKGGGVCVNCKDHTSGYNCEKCMGGFYRVPGKSQWDKNACQVCQCNERGSVNNKCNQTGGQCPCRQFVAGLKCNRCQSNYWHFPNCRPCNCSEFGSLEKSCNPVTGQCSCKPGVLGLNCDRCEADDKLNTKTDVGCLKCHPCSVDVLNDVISIRSSVLQWTNLTCKLPSWIHLRLFWLENIYKNLSQNALLMPRNMTSKAVRLLHSIRRYSATLHQLLDNLEMNYTISKAKDVKMSTKSLLSNCSKLEKRVALDSASVFHAAELLIGFTWRLERTPSHYSQRTVETMEETGGNLLNNIQAANFTLAKEMAIKEREASMALRQRVPKSFQKRTRRLKSRLNRINRWLTELYSNSLKSITASLNVLHLDVPSRIDHFKKTSDLLHSEWSSVRKILNIPIEAFWKKYLNRIEEERGISETLSKKISQLDEVFLTHQDDVKEIVTNYESLLNHVSLLEQKSSETIRIFNGSTMLLDPFNTALSQMENFSLFVHYSHKVCKQAIDKINELNDNLLEKNLRSSGAQKYSVWNESDDPESSGDVDEDIEAMDGDGFLPYETTLETHSASDEVISPEIDLILVQKKIKDKRNELKTVSDAMSLCEKGNNETRRVVLHLMTKPANLLRASMAKPGEFQLTSTIVNNIMNDDHLNQMVKNLSNACRETNRSIERTVGKTAELAPLVHSTTQKVQKTIRRYDEAMLNCGSRNRGVNRTNSNRTSLLGAVKANIQHIQIPLKFKSPGYVGIRTAWNLAYSHITSMVMWFKTESLDVQLLQLGRVSSSSRGCSIRLYLNNSRLVIVIRHNTQSWMAQHPLPVTPHYWHQLEIEWILDRVHVNLKSVQSSYKSFSKKTSHFLPWGGVVHRRFTPFVWLGGLPDDMKRLMDGNPISDLDGCIGGVRINRQPVPLYFWDFSRGVQAPCPFSHRDGRRKLSTISFTDGDTLEILPDFNDGAPIFPSLEFSFRTVQKDAVLFLLVDDQQKEWIIIRLDDGKIVVEFQQPGGGPAISLHSAKAYNDGKLHHVTCSTRYGKWSLHLAVDTFDRHSGLSWKMVQNKTQIYLGGVPRHFETTFMHRTFQDFNGCLMGVKINNRSLNIHPKHGQAFEVTRTVCPLVMGRCMCLNTGSRMPIQVKRLGFKIEVLGISFSVIEIKSNRSRRTVLYHSTSEHSKLQVYVNEEGEVWVEWYIADATKSGSRSEVGREGRQRLAPVVNAAWHNLLIRNLDDEGNGRYILNLDGTQVELPTDLFMNRFSAQHILVLGGQPLTPSLSSDLFPICFDNFLLNDELKDFSQYSISNGLYSC